MATFLDLATDALYEIGVLGVGQTPNPDDAALCLREFNRMTSEWSVDRLNLFFIANGLFQLTANTQSYTWGVNGIFNQPRPILIQTAAAIVQGTTARMPDMALLSSQQFAALLEKGLVGVFPERIYCDYNAPVATVQFHPIPSGPIQVEIYFWTVMQQIVGLTDLLQFPPAYENALKFNLAAKLFSSFGMPVNPLTIQQASAGKMAFQKLNAEIYGGAVDARTMMVMPTLGAPTPPMSPPAQPPQ